MPIYDYDHIYGYKSDIGHIEDEITLLCPQHHRAKTVGLLPLEKVISANANPFNKRKGVSTGYHLEYGSGTYEIVMANLLLTDSRSQAPYKIPLLINENAPIIFKVVDGELLLNMNLIDQHGNKLLSIVDNELVYSIEAVDVKFVGSTLTIRHAESEFKTILQFAPPNRIYIKRLQFSCDDHLVTIAQKNMFIQYPPKPGSEVGHIVNLKGGEPVPGVQLGTIDGAVAIQIGKGIPGITPAMDMTL